MGVEHSWMGRNLEAAKHTAKFGWPEAMQNHQDVMFGR